VQRVPLLSAVTRETFTFRVFAEEDVRWQNRPSCRVATAPSLRYYTNSYSGGTRLPSRLQADAILHLQYGHKASVHPAQCAFDRVLAIFIYVRLNAVKWDPYPIPKNQTPC
jgi:hypothetical protein